MGKWDFWGWLTYSCVFVAAVILALDTGLKGSATMADLPFLHSTPWDFAPLVLMTVSGLLLLARALGWIGKKPVPITTTLETKPPAAISMTDSAGNIFTGPPFEHVERA